MIAALIYLYKSFFMNVQNIFHFFADYDETRRHFKHLCFKVCQLHKNAGQTYLQKTVVKFIQNYANDKNTANTFRYNCPFWFAVQRVDLLTVILILQYF
jgi:hypothetical protein